MINIICALQCEAQPLISFFRLKRDMHSRSFSLYTNATMSLTISGVNKINAAAGVAYSHAYLGTAPDDIWLNVGIAGHSTLAIGQAVIAHKISDQSNRQTFYPQILPDVSCPTAELISVEQVANDYGTSMYDMEASGFYATASRFATTELIHSFKVISDNRLNPNPRFSKSFVSGLIEKNVITLEQFISRLQTLSGQLETTDCQSIDAFLSQWHFTQYERHQLTAILHRWAAIAPKHNPFTEVQNLKRGKDVLDTLSARLDTMPIHFSSSDD